MGIITQISNSSWHLGHFTITHPDVAIGHVLQDTTLEYCFEKTKPHLGHLTRSFEVFFHVAIDSLSNFRLTLFLTFSIILIIKF